MSADIVTVYRPVGQAELDLIRADAMQSFPPRLAHQPIFYPVTNEAYATQIARDWNTRDAVSGPVGYVTRFEVHVAFLDRHERKIGGGRQHEGHWIPAADLDAFNRAIVGPLEVIAEFRR